MTRNKYEMEELLPIVSMLAEKYTSKESSSITYERAEQLMEAVLYCIKEDDKEDSTELLNPEETRNSNAFQAYTRGYELVCNKVRMANDVYVQIMETFDAYGQRVLQETVVEGMASFFAYYDVRFAPMDHLLTLDYPVMLAQNTMSGIDLIYEYLKAIEVEQEFLSSLDRNYIINVLTSYNSEYEDGLDNLARIMYRNLIAVMIERRKNEREPYGNIQLFVRSRTKEQLKEGLGGLLHVLIESRYKNAVGIEAYLRNDLDDFAIELINAEKNNCLKAVIPL